jgi:hypothetical protein
MPETRSGGCERIIDKKLKTGETVGKAEDGYSWILISGTSVGETKLAI